MNPYKRVEWDSGLQRFCVWDSPTVCFTSSKKEIAEAYARGGESAVSRAQKNQPLPAVEAPLVERVGSTNGFGYMVGEAFRSKTQEVFKRLSLLLRDVASGEYPEKTAGDLEVEHRKRVRAALREGAMHKVMLRDGKTTAAVLCPVCGKNGCGCVIDGAESAGTILLPNNAVLLRPGTLYTHKREAHLGATERV